MTRYEEDESGVEVEGRERVETISTIFGSRNQIPFGGIEGGDKVTSGTWWDVSGNGYIYATDNVVAKGDYSMAVTANDEGGQFTTKHVTKIPVKQGSLVFVSAFVQASTGLTTTRFRLLGVQTGRNGTPIVIYDGKDYGSNYGWKRVKYLFRIKDAAVDYAQLAIQVENLADDTGALYIDEINVHVLRSLNHELTTPIHESYSGSITAGGSDTVSVTVPDGEIWRINTTNQIDSETDINLDWIKAGGVKISTSHLTNREVLLFQGESLTAQYSNSGASSETAYLKVHGRGFK